FVMSLSLARLSVDRNGPGPADLAAFAAVGARGLVDLVLLLAFAGDGVHRAGLRTQRAAVAGIEDGVGEQRLALVRGALLVRDVRLVLRAEVLEGGEDGVGRGLPQAAE